MAHGEAAITRRANSIGRAVPTFEEMQRNFNTLTQDRYEEIMMAKPYMPNHHLRSNLGKTSYFNAKSILETST
jgi:hypothetical protein